MSRSVTLPAQPISLSEDEHVLSPSMPSKGSKDEYGVKDKGRKKADKAKRTFELNGTYTAKHMRLKEERDEKAKAARVGTAPPPGIRKTRSFGEHSLLAALPDVKPKKGAGKKS